MVKKVGNSLAERHFFLFRMFFCNPVAFGNHTLFQANQFNAVLLNFFLIGKSFLETMREIDAKEQQQEEAREAAMQAQLAEQEKREKEAYGKKSWKFACRAAFFSFQDVLLQSGRFR